MKTGTKDVNRRNRLPAAESDTRRATIRDVAAHAGVSIGTASKALNGQGKLRAETRARVVAAARELGFSPNVLARGLLAGRTYTVFDECLLAALPREGTWRAVFDSTRGCVQHREEQLDVLPSQPQAVFGAGVKDLAIR